MPGHRMGVHGCRAKKTYISTNFPCEIIIKVLELQCWRKELGDKASTSKKPYQKKCVILARIREDQGNIYYFVTYSPTH